MVLAHTPKKEPAPHHRKRHGQHHKSSARHYAKTYWPYIPMLLIVTLGFVAHTFMAAPSKVLDYATSVSTTSLLQESNIQRSNNGVGALALNGLLSQAAQEKANDMAARDYWSHATPEGRQPWQFISAAGYKYGVAGENLAYGFDSSSGIVSGWMNSSGHRDNLLNSGFKDVGFGIANASNFQGEGEQTIIVAMYASPYPTPSAPVAQVKTPAPTPPAPAPTPPTPVAQTAEIPAPSLPNESDPTPAEPQANTDTTKKDTVTTNAVLTPKTVSRIDVMTDGNAQWAILAASALIAIGAISLVYRHGKMWHRYLVKGERFIMHHPVLDIVVVATVVIGVVLSATAGAVL